jgi:hypothetical protein
MGNPLGTQNPHGYGFGQNFIPVMGMSFLASVFFLRGYGFRQVIPNEFLLVAISNRKAALGMNHPGPRRRQEEALGQRGVGVVVGTGRWAWWRPCAGGGERWWLALLVVVVGGVAAGGRRCCWRAALLLAASIENNAGVGDRRGAGIGDRG